LKKSAKEIERTLEDMIAQLNEDRRFARELKRPAAAIAASLAIAKLLGHMAERKTVDILGTVAEMSDEELDREIAALLGRPPGGATH